MNLNNLTYEIENGIGVLTVNRPDKLNALNRETLIELDGLLDVIKIDDSRVLILTGSGQKAFVAGADINELNMLNADTAFEFAKFGQAVFSKIENLGKPVIAAVNGYALGGGCELSLACHLRFVSPNAKFGQPEVKLGIIPGYGGTQRLARIIGLSKAIEYSLTGDMIDSDTALSLGLANRVIDENQLIAECKKYADKIISLGSIAVSKILEAIIRGRNLSITDGLEIEAKLFSECCATEDFKEGTEAFLQKRAPHFNNK